MKRLRKLLVALKQRVAQGEIDIPDSQKTIEELERIIAEKERAPIDVSNTEFNMLDIKSADRPRVFLIAALFSVGILMYYWAYGLIENQFQSMMTLMMFAGVLPCVFNLRVRLWMAGFSAHQNFFRVDHEVPTSCGLAGDWVNLILVTAALIFIISGLFTGALVKTTDQTSSNTEEMQQKLTKNVVAICMSLVSAVLLGVACAEVRILCSFKEIRSQLKQQNYNYLKILFWTMLAS